MCGENNFCECVRIEGWADGGGYSEDGADAWIVVRLGALEEGGLHSGIGFGESSDFGEKAGVLKRIFAHAIGFGRFAKILITREICDAASELDYDETAKRKTGCAHALGVDAGAKGWVGEELIEKSAQVMGALAPENCAGDSVVLESVVSGMIYGGSDETVRGECGAKPGHHVRRAADAVGEQNQREFFWSCDGLGVARGLASAAERCIGGADPLGLLEGGGIGGIPDVGDEGVGFCAAPVVRFGRSELAVHYPDFINDDFGGAGLGSG